MSHVARLCPYSDAQKSAVRKLMGFGEGHHAGKPAARKAKKGGGRKKPRTPKQIAATKRMLAARKAKHGGKKKKPRAKKRAAKKKKVKR